MLEKIRFVLRTLASARKGKKIQKEKNDGWVVRIIRRVAKIIAIAVVAFVALALWLYYFMPPTILVTDAQDKTIHTNNSKYTLRGRISSGGLSQLTINNKPVRLVGGDFATKVELNEGDNQFIIEATNSRGTTEEIYIIKLD